MKQILMSLSLMLFASTSQANTIVSPFDLMVEMQSRQIIADAQLLNMIDWKVGDFMKYRLSSPFGGGEALNTVASEERASNGDDAIWIKNTMNILGQNQVVEILMSRVDGSILKFKQNGRETNPPNNDLEIIEQEYTRITVPAGSFDCLRVLAKTSLAPRIEVWANPSETAMDGGLKQVVQSGFMTITMELIEFKKN